MRKLLIIAALAVLPLSAQAQFTLGARLGYAPAMGDEAKDVALSDSIAGQIPFQLDGLYRFTPQFAAGLYFSYGFGRLNSDVSDMCDAQGLDCSAKFTRLGVEATYSFTNASPQFVPWVGAGLGYEWYTAEASVSGFTGSATTSGFEFLNLQLGGDYKVSDQFAIGPYVMMSIGQYSSIEGTDIPDKGVHEWVNFGLRAKFDL